MLNGWIKFILGIEIDNWWSWNFHFDFHINHSSWWGMWQFSIFVFKLALSVLIKFSLKKSWGPYLSTQCLVPHSSRKFLSILILYLSFHGFSVYRLLSRQYALISKCGEKFIQKCPKKKIHIKEDFTLEIYRKKTYE